MTRKQASGAVTAAFAVPQSQGLIHEVYNAQLKPAAIGALAKCVQAAFSEGDEVAIGILRAAADELEGAALSVARRLDLIEASWRAYADLVVISGELP